MTRNIVVNGRFLTRRVTGVERYGREILRYMGSRPALREGCLVASTRRQGWAGHAWEQLILPAKLGPHSILWSPANTGPLLIRNQALTIHDLSPLEHPEWFRGAFTLWYRLFLPILARQVRQVFTPSEYVKQKVMKRFGIRNVTVTPNGVNRSVFHPGAAQTRLDLPACYVLFVGTLEPRKNLDLLLRAWNEISKEFRQTWLIVVGVNGNVFRHMSYPSGMERVRFLGYVDDETLAGLYANASLFVLPSQEEGFGLPAIEAMASGTPVIVSNGGALPEVVGEAGMIFNLPCHAEARSNEASPPRSGGILPGTAPDLLSKSGRCRSWRDTPLPQNDISQLTTAMKECVSDPGLRATLREKGLKRAAEFSWEQTAVFVWKSLHEI